MNKTSFAIPILLLAFVELMSCSIKSIGKQTKTKYILGQYDLDSLSQSKSFPYPAYLKTITLNKGNELFYQIPYPGHEAPPVSINGKPIVFVTKGSWRRNSDTLYLTFGSDADGDKVETCLFRSDSIISIKSTDRKIWTKRKN